MYGAHEPVGEGRREGGGAEDAGQGRERIERADGGGAGECWEGVGGV